MIKTALITMLILASTTTYASVTEQEDVSFDEIQQELDALDENMVLNQEDDQFLSQESEGKKALELNATLNPQKNQPVKKAETTVDTKKKIQK